MDVVYGPLLALDPTTNLLVPDASGEIFAVDDTAFTTPLPVTDLSGVTMAQVTSGANGVLDEFIVQDELEVLWKSGSNVIHLISFAGVLAQSAAAAAAAEAAQAAAEQAVADVAAYIAGGGGGGGTSDHGLLSGLNDDDHGQYHTDARGDARYYTKAAADTLLAAAATSASSADRNRANHTGTDPNNSIPVAAVDTLESRLAALEAGSGGANPFGTLFRTLASFSGANDSAKFRQSCTDVASMTNKPIVLIPPGTTLDAGANNPFILPTGYHMMCVPGPEDEFGYSGKVNIRHTGSSSGSAGHGVFQYASGSKGQKFSGIAFHGTSSVRAFVDVALDGSDGRFPQYVTFFNVSFNQFESVMTTTGTGIKWLGVCYINNMVCSRPPLHINGSDHTLFSNGGLMEMGAVASYATRAALTAMFHGSNLSNCSIGPVYWTGSPTTPVRIDNGAAGVNFTDGVFEGRPSPGTVGGDTPTDGLHCAGALMRLTGGRGVIRAREHGYAMRHPSNLAGYQPGGFYHISGGDWVIDGGTFTPYAASVYPAWTRPDGVAYPVDTIPPLAWVTGASTRLNIKNITRGANATSTPVVYADNGATVIADGSVTVITV